jgi:hypothetical protein
MTRRRAADGAESPGRHARRHGHRADRAARSAWGRAAEEQPRRLGLYRASPKMHGPGRGRLRQRALRIVSRTRWALPVTRSRWASWTRSAAPAVNLKEPASAPRRAGCRFHQHRLPRPHRRRDPHLDGSRPDGPQGRYEGRSSGFKAYEDSTTSTSGLACRPARQARRSARACGPRPTCMAEMIKRQKISPPAAPAPIDRLGALADRRDAARARTTTPSMCSPDRQDEIARPQAPRRSTTF